MDSDAARHYFTIHGLGVAIDLGVQSLAGEFHRLLKPFEINLSNITSTVIVGSIQPFDDAEVLRGVTRNAMALPVADDLIELYRDGERYWLVDERWGMVEINLLKRSFRAWVLPAPTVHLPGVVESALLWPLAQLMRPRGVHLLPAISVAKGDWGALILAPFSIEPHLSRLVRAGYSLVGQRWTAIRQEATHLSLLHVPGMVQPIRPPCFGQTLGQVPADWIDLTRENPWAQASQARCRAVIVVEPGRRLQTCGRRLSAVAATALLRHAWPIVQLPPPSNGRSFLPKLLAQQCPCLQVQLSRDVDPLLYLIESLRQHHPAPSPDPCATVTRPAKSVKVARPAFVTAGPVARIVA